MQPRPPPPGLRPPPPRPPPPRGPPLPPGCADGRLITRRSPNEAANLSKYE